MVILGKSQIWGIENEREREQGTVFVGEKWTGLDNGRERVRRKMHAQCIKNKE